MNVLQNFSTQKENSRTVNHSALTIKEIEVKWDTTILKKSWRKHWNGILQKRRNQVKHLKKKVKCVKRQKRINKWWKKKQRSINHIIQKRKKHWNRTQWKSNSIREFWKMNSQFCRKQKRRTKLWTRGLKNMQIKETALYSEIVSWISKLAFSNMKLSDNNF